MVKKIKYLTHNFAQGVRFVNYMFYRFVSLTASKRAQEEDIQNGAEGLSGSFFIINLMGVCFAVTKIGFGNAYFIKHPIPLTILVLFVMIMTHRLVYAKDKHIAIFAQFKKENKKSNKVIFYIYLLCSSLIFWILKKL